MSAFFELWAARFGAMALGCLGAAIVIAGIAWFVERALDGDWLAIALVALLLALGLSGVSAWVQVSR